MLLSYLNPEVHHTSALGAVVAERRYFAAFSFEASVNSSSCLPAE